MRLLDQIQPIDLIRFGFIPEFIGRLPVVGVLEDLNREALVQILTKPKNAIIRQYQKLFEFENVRLKFSDEALEAIAGSRHGTQSWRSRVADDPRRTDAGPDVLSPLRRRRSANSWSRKRWCCRRKSAWQFLRRPG